MSNVMPSLSEDSWCFSGVKIADYMLAHFFLSDYSQTYIYFGQVSSLPWIITDNQGNIGATCAATQRTLQTYFSRYFNNVVVEVSEEPNVDEPSKAQMSIYVKFTEEDGTTQVVGKMLTINDTVIEKIINISNGT